MLTRIIPLLALCLASAASAQTAQLTPDTRVLITKIPRGQLFGTLRSWSLESLLVETSGGELRAIPLNTVRRVAVPEPRDPLSGAAHYAAIGGAVGGAFGWMLVGRSPGDSEEKLQFASWLAVRTAAIGALIGLAAPGERWAPVTLPPPPENDPRPETRMRTMHQFRPSDPVRLGLNDGQLITGEYRALRDDRIEMLDPDTVRVPTTEVPAVWKGQSAWKEGALTGGLVGCTALYLTVALDRKISGPAFPSSEWDSLACSAGGLAGVLLGAAVGSGITVWVPQPR